MLRQTATHLKRIQQLEQELDERHKAKENEDERMREEKQQTTLKLEEEKRRAEFAANEASKLREVRTLQVLSISDIF